MWTVLPICGIGLHTFWVVPPGHRAERNLCLGVGMAVITSFVSAVYFVLDTVLSLYFWIILAAVVLSWVNPDPYNPIVRGIRSLTEPVFYRVRKWMPFTFMSGIDFSPVVVMLAIKFVQVFLAQLLGRMMFL
jgi:YggT family protein